MTRHATEKPLERCLSDKSYLVILTNRSTSQSLSVNQTVSQSIAIGQSVPAPPDPVSAVLAHKDQRHGLVGALLGQLKEHRSSIPAFWALVVFGSAECVVLNDLSSDEDLLLGLVVDVAPLDSVLRGAVWVGGLLDVAPLAPEDQLPPLLILLGIQQVAALGAKLHPTHLADRQTDRQTDTRTD